MKNTKITIVGLGLMGASLAKQLKKEGYKYINGIDLDHKIIEIALTKNIIDTSSMKKMKNSSIVFICLYPQTAKEFIKNNKTYFSSNVIITDMSGVKNNSYTDIFNQIESTQCYVPGHPMAGREEGGFKNSIDDLYKGANYLLVNNYSQDSIKVLIEVLESLSVKIAFVESQEHDRMIALTSQLPHIVSVIINRLNIYNDTKTYVGNSFDEMTRIGLINHKLWSQLFILNKKYLVRLLKHFRDEIDNFIKVIETENQDSLEKMLIKSNNRRKEYLKSCKK